MNAWYSASYYFLVGAWEISIINIIITYGILRGITHSLGTSRAYIEGDTQSNDAPKWRWEFMGEVIVLTTYFPLLCSHLTVIHDPPMSSESMQFLKRVKTQLPISERPVYYRVQHSPKATLNKQRTTNAWVFFCSWAINHNLKRLFSVGASCLISALLYYLATFIHLLVIITQMSMILVWEDHLLIFLRAFFPECCWHCHHLAETKSSNLSRALN